MPSNPPVIRVIRRGSSTPRFTTLHEALAAAVPHIAASIREGQRLATQQHVQHTPSSQTGRANVRTNVG